jgi:prepilin-type N-terminal cleavage/methylation domain-containing protein
MKRRGYTILELLIVVGLLSLLIAGATVLLSTVVRHFARQSSGYQEVRVADRLAASLRRDVRSASDVNIAASGNAEQGKLLLMGASGQTIEYTVADRGVERIAQSGGAAEREFFRLPSLREGRFTHSGARVSFIWAHGWQGSNRAENTEETPRRHRIDAALQGGTANE